MQKRYPNDCSAACAKKAEWLFTYNPRHSPTKWESMQACNDHRSEIRAAADISAIGGFPIEYRLKV